MSQGKTYKKEGLLRLRIMFKAIRYEIRVEFSLVYIVKHKELKSFLYGPISCWLDKLSSACIECQQAYFMKVFGRQGQGIIVKT